MKRSFFQTARRTALALTALTLAAPFLLPASALVSPAAAQETQKADTSRIVVIGGALTEIVYALGEQDRLIARDTTSTFPEAAMSLPDVGYMRALSPEGVLGVNPSAILAIEGSGPPDALAVLKNAGVSFTTVPEGYDRAAILDKIAKVGDFLGVPDKAKTLADEVGADLDTAIADAAKRPESERKRVLFILSFQDGKIMAAGAHTAADGILKLAGAVNATDAAFPGYKAMADEAIADARPDAIMVMSRGGHDSSDEQLLAHPAIALTPAAASKTIIRMNSLELLGFGPRTASAIRDLNERLYGKANVSQ
ncbi:ABC transporter substrate-binding protein [Rhizobium sp. TRM96647]|uniref:heme/hemin ABC transporter substrate-binding protein n=1 Tax=unclassified Rhizobium TaxID=2613769 RepID=UPI0021E93DEA|nr:MULTISPECIES: ABC transporter substrate-binding protein [unclassified Rhizobium]MCV3735750.1 ABC transporter substrate-binding protein [Rhizobium sp. TRM96647]MCV3758588.1 ABC transporter substrate-binding protein [Rhizobium sp. TRM96650]